LIIEADEGFDSAGTEVVAERLDLSLWKLAQSWVLLIQRKLVSLLGETDNPVGIRWVFTHKLPFFPVGLSNSLVGRNSGLGFNPISDSHPEEKKQFFRGF
jgi:hypothetical protein